MKSYAIIGAGVSGLSIARMLQEKGYQVKVYEAAKTQGGLVRCTREEHDVLYHRVGGHVFNSRREDVLEWFWNLFQRDEDFVSTPRHAEIYFSPDCWVGYPIENHLRALPQETRHQILDELLEMQKNESVQPTNLADFFKTRFGKTLNEIYFTPYNDKIWQMDCKHIPMAWLEGKLPMPTLRDILIANIDQSPETNMVHSSFYYPKQGGSQFIADTLAQGLDLVCDAEVRQIKREQEKWIVNGETFDAVVYTANIKELPSLLEGSFDLSQRALAGISELESHGTCSVLCKLTPNDYSWVYIPNPAIKSHRVICTGNFSKHNNGDMDMTGTVEFSCPMTKEEILEQLAHIPFSPEYITHHWEPYTYPIAGLEGRATIEQVKRELAPLQFYLHGRFAEWEYYNMDTAIGAALDKTANM